MTKGVNSTTSLYISGTPETTSGLAKDWNFVLNATAGYCESLHDKAIISLPGRDLQPFMGPPTTDSKKPWQRKL
jgi:hypothetical protein